jgi:hypothetical protein
MGRKACEEYWWQDPAVLINPERKTATLCPKIGCKSDGINALTRTVIIALLVGVIAYLYDGGVLGLVIAAITGILLSLPIIITMMRGGDEVVEENFEDGGSPDVTDVIAGTMAPDMWTTPSANNPFMNVLVSEYGSNPSRGAAVSVEEPAVKQSLNDLFRTQWYSDPTDVFGRNQSQRQFITMPNTMIPNDRESYQNWLYKIPGKTCKEGGRQACLPATDGGPVTWLNFDA